MCNDKSYILANNLVNQTRTNLSIWGYCKHPTYIGKTVMRYYIIGLVCKVPFLPFQSIPAMNLHGYLSLRSFDKRLNTLYVWILQLYHPKWSKDLVHTSDTFLKELCLPGHSAIILTENRARCHWEGSYRFWWKLENWRMKCGTNKAMAIDKSICHLMGF